MVQRIKDFAKKINFDVNDVISEAQKVGISGKNQSSSLSDEEAAKLLNAITLGRQISSMEDYLDGKIVIPSKKKPKKAEKKEEPKADVKAEPKSEVKAEPKPEVKAEPKPNVKPEIKAEPKPEVKTEVKSEPKAEQKTQAPAAPKPEDKAEAKVGVRKASEINERAKNAMASKGTDRKDYRTDFKKPAQKNDAAPSAAQKPDFRQKDGFKKDFSQDKKPFDRQGGDFRKGGDFRRDDRGSFGGYDKDAGSRRPQYNPAPKVKHPESNTVEIKKKTGATRIVDTRTVDIDLSKYDDKTDMYASSYEAYGQSTSKQKLKKQNTKDTYGSKKEKERMAMEKMKREVFEKAKNTKLSITVPDEITVGELATRLKVTSGEVIKKLMMMGVMASVNQTIDYDTAYLIGDELGVKVSKEVVVTIEEKLFDDEKDPEKDLVERAPVVCVMGHVDHGKTSLLDAIRHTNVISGEAGGITQHIGAYRVNIKGKDITFLDTPGHEAFTAMRLRGAMATDIAIIVVAADDGIMPQTIEAINHAKAAGVDIIVAINKMDKPAANPDAVKQELTKYDLVPEEWGGDVICVPVSAVTGKGIDDLLENILLVAEVKELKANPKRHAKGIVIEAKLDKGRGPVATILVQNGTLHAGDVVIAGTAVGRVRAMTDHNGKSLKEAGPSVPVEITGLDGVPTAGDEFNAVEDEKMARELAGQRRSRAKEEIFKSSAKVNLDDLFSQINEGAKEINVIIKADVGGSCEAVRSSLEKLSNDEVKIKVIHTAVGGITESDVMLAAASNAIIVGFNVRPDKNAIDSAARQNVDIRTHRIIYEIIEEMEAAMKGLLAPEYKEVINGHAEVRQTIRVPSVGTIAGSYVRDGKVTRTSQIRILRDGIVIAEDKISSLRRFKDDVKEVAAGYECGIGLEKFNDIREGDVLEAFVVEEVAR